MDKKNLNNIRRRIASGKDYPHPPHPTHSKRNVFTTLPKITLDNNQLQFIEFLVCLGVSVQYFTGS